MKISLELRAVITCDRCSSYLHQENDLHLNANQVCGSRLSNQVEDTIKMCQTRLEKVYGWRSVNGEFLCIECQKAYREKMSETIAKMNKARKERKERDWVWQMGCDEKTAKYLYHRGYKEKCLILNQFNTGVEPEYEVQRENGQIFRDFESNFSEEK